MRAEEVWTGFGLGPTVVSEARTATRAATALAPVGPIMFEFRQSSSTLLDVLSRRASHRMVAPSSPSVFPPIEILMSEALSLRASDIAVMPSVVLHNSLPDRLS